MIFSRYHPVADRLGYEVFILDITGMGRRRRIAAARSMIQNRYTGELKTARIRLFKNGPKDNSWICLVFQSKKKFRTCVFPTLYIVNRLKEFTGYAGFAGKNFVESVRMENGSAVSAIVAGRPSGRDATGELARLCPQGTVYGKIFRSETGFIAGRRKDLLKAPVGKPSLTDIVVAAVLIDCVSAAAVPVAGLCAARMHETLVREDMVQKQQLQQLGMLQKQYEVMMQEKLSSAHTLIPVLYNCVERDDRIDKMMITGSTFEIDVHTQNAKALCMRLENSGVAGQIKMNRRFINTGMSFSGDSVIYSGVIRTDITYPAQSQSTAEKTAFYSQKIEEEQSEKNTVQESDILKTVTRLRSVLNSCGCMENYLQYKQQNNDMEIEYSFNSNYTQFFKFLKSAEELQPPVGFTAVNVEKGTSKDEICVVVLIYTGLPAQEPVAVPDLAVSSPKKNFVFMR
jgi:hypothetical protein